MGKKRLIIFGATGSVGKNSLAVIRRNRDKFEVLGLCAYRNVKLLNELTQEFNPRYLCVVDERTDTSILHKKAKVFKGERGLDEFSSLQADISIMAIVGINCLKPLLKNMRYTKRIGLASKESLVVAGDILMREARKHNVELLPVDSEINALVQLFKGIRKKYLKKVYLTASGGALWNVSVKRWEKLKVTDVLKHPTWKMGKRITVDSATLVNKGFEVMETHFLFKLDYEKIDLLVQRNSFVHAMIETVDGNIFACIYKPDMKVPLSYVLFYPTRENFSSCETLWHKKLMIPLEPINLKKYPLLQLILEAREKKSSFPVVVNAADEEAVGYFLKGKIGFVDLIKIVEDVARSHQDEVCSNLDSIFFWDHWARRKVQEFVKERV